MSTSNVTVSMKWFGDAIMKELSNARKNALRQIGSEAVSIMASNLRGTAKKPTGKTESTLMWATKDAKSTSATGEEITSPKGVSSVVVGSAHGGFPGIGSIEYGAHGPYNRTMKGLGFMNKSKGPINTRWKNKTKEYSKPIIDKSR